MGANLGDRRANIARAMELLGQSGDIRVVRQSELLETDAVGGPEDSPRFLNGAAELETTLSPESLLGRLHEIEAEIGRIRRTRWEPRIIDLDLLLFGAPPRVIDNDQIHIPHPLMHQRRFVLEPLAQIAPAVVHPVLGKTIRELLAGL